MVINLIPFKAGAWLRKISTWLFYKFLLIKMAEIYQCNCTREQWHLCSLYKVTSTVRNIFENEDTILKATAIYIHK